MTELTLANQLNAPTGFRQTVNIDDIWPGMTIMYWNIGKMSNEILVIDIDVENRKLRCLDHSEFTLEFDRRVIYIPSDF